MAVTPRLGVCVCVCVFVGVFVCVFVCELCVCVVYRLPVVWKSALMDVSCPLKKRVAISLNSEWLQKKSLVTVSSSEAPPLPNEEL